MRLAQYKLPVKTKFITLDDQEQAAAGSDAKAASTATVEA
jgi:large subunit ribosomal protein L16